MYFIIRANNMDKTKDKCNYFGVYTSVTGRGRWHITDGEWKR